MEVDAKLEEIKQQANDAQNRYLDTKKRFGEIYHLIQMIQSDTQTLETVTGFREIMEQHRLTRE